MREAAQEASREPARAHPAWPRTQAAHPARAARLLAWPWLPAWPGLAWRRICRPEPASVSRTRTQLRWLTAAGPALDLLDNLDQHRHLLLLLHAEAALDLGALQVRPLGAELGGQPFQRAAGRSPRHDLGQRPPCEHRRDHPFPDALRRRP